MRYLLKLRLLKPVLLATPPVARHFAQRSQSIAIFQYVEMGGVYVIQLQRIHG
jgi:hypothetical protein